MRLLIATDAWFPQVNGVVRTLSSVGREAEALGFEVSFLTPREFRTVPCPSYPEIRLSLCIAGMAARRIDAFGPDFIHIATEGPIGLATRSYCRKGGRPFTTSYHTRFPEYISARWPVPERWIYALQRRFHNSGAGMMVATQSMRSELAKRGFANIMPWTRGVETGLFKPARRRSRTYPRPVFLNVGRVAVEKNIKAFLELDLPGSKLVVGEGPELARLRGLYPHVHFLGPKFGEELAACYADADVFAFPSLTDTFGNVMLEALACGTPVAAFPVTGPLDVIGGSAVGVLDQDLERACRKALDIPRKACRDFALERTWTACARQFLRNVLEANGRPEAAQAFMEPAPAA